MNVKLRFAIGCVVGAALFFLTLLTAPGEGIQAFVATSSAVQVPEALVLALNAGLFALLTAGFAALLNWIGLDLLEYVLPLAGTLSGFLIGVVQHWIDIQPISSDPYILMALNIIVVVIGGLPFLLIARKNNLI